MSHKANRQIKDSLFVDYFSKDEVVGKENFLALYNLLSGQNLSLKDTRLEDVRLEQIVYKTFYNDLSMLINDRIVVLCEHQSTINENLPLRYLIYCARIYEKILDPNLKFARRLQKIPRPEFYVLYNGNQSYPPHKKLFLSQAFSEENIKSNHSKFEIFPLELSVDIYNINQENCPLNISSCLPLQSYVKFIRLVERERASAFDENFMARAIKKAQAENLLPQYLERKISEVENMLFTEYDYETDIKVKTEEAKTDAKTEAAIRMLKRPNADLRIIAEDLDLPLETVRKLSLTLSST